jgi:GNAT superfamily N-acetyltransferase
MTDDRVRVREATADELAAVLGVLDAAVLETDADRVRERIDSSDVLVAVSDPSIASGTDDTAATLVGALVLDGDEIVNVAVRRRRRGQGIATALVESAAARRDRLVAEFDSDVSPFYESLGFDVETVGDTDRREGVYRTD